MDGSERIPLADHNSIISHAEIPMLRTRSRSFEPTTPIQMGPAIKSELSANSVSQKEYLSDQESFSDIDEYLIPKIDRQNESLTSPEKKKILFYLTPAEAQKQLEDWVETEMQKLNGDRDIKQCWLHSSPGFGCEGSVGKSISWLDTNGKRQAVRVALGVATLFLKNQADDATLSGEQMEGLVLHGWHLSQ